MPTVWSKPASHHTTSIAIIPVAIQHSPVHEPTSLINSDQYISGAQESSRIVLYAEDESDGRKYTPITSGADSLPDTILRKYFPQLRSQLEPSTHDYFSVLHPSLFALSSLCFILRHLQFITWAIVPLLQHGHRSTSFPRA